jgi:hypothetical protein
MTPPKISSKMPRPRNQPHRLRRLSKPTKCRPAMPSCGSVVMVFFLFSSRRLVRNAYCSRSHRRMARGFRSATAATTIAGSAAAAAHRGRVRGGLVERTVSKPLKSWPVWFVACEAWCQRWSVMSEVNEMTRSEKARVVALRVGGVAACRPVLRMPAGATAVNVAKGSDSLRCGFLS